MSNFKQDNRLRLISTRMLARCNSTGREFSLGPVDVIARYADCSVFVCPECNGQHDDRPAWNGPSEARMGYTVVTNRVGNADEFGRTWIAPWT